MGLFDRILRFASGAARDAQTTDESIRSSDRKIDAPTVVVGASN